MGYFVAFPAELVEELLRFLPEVRRSVYAERFERIVGDLVWVQDDTENAVRSALRARDDPLASLRTADASRVRACVEVLMDQEFDVLVTQVQQGLCMAAEEVVQRRLAEVDAGGRDSSSPME
jgi:hypothetical protein